MAKHVKDDVFCGFDWIWAASAVNPNWQTHGWERKEDGKKPFLFSKWPSFLGAKLAAGFRDK